MEKRVIGRFYAKSFDNNFIEFIVYDDNTMDCPTMNVYSFIKLIIKPRFVMYDGKNDYEYNVSSKRYGRNTKLIQDYDIDEELFQYLKNNEMIRYSNDMAYLYGFNDKKGFDSEPRYYGVGSSFKRAKKKGPILVKQRNGQFN